KPACGAWAWAGDRAEPDTAMARAMVQNLMVWPPWYSWVPRPEKWGTARYQSSGFFNDDGSDPLLDHHEPGLAGHRRQPAARVDGQETHRDAVLHVAADRLDVAAAHVSDDVAMARRAGDGPPRRALVGMPPGRSGRAGADEIARLGRVFVGSVQQE